MILNENLSLILIIFIFSISIYLIKNPFIIDHFNICELNNKDEQTCNNTILCGWNNNKCDYKYKISEFELPKLPNLPKLV
jgi:hypothetical protein